MSTKFINLQILDFQRQKLMFMYTENAIMNI